MEFEHGHAAPIFEAIASAVAVAILSCMVLRMQRQARSIESEIEARAAAAISTGQLFTLAFIAFITVLREGLETAVFLSALATRASGPRALARCRARGMPWEVQTPQRPLPCATRCAGS